MVQLLQPTLQDLIAWGLSADKKHGGLVAEGGGDTRYGVCHTGSCRHNGNTGDTGKSAPGFGSMGCRLFVSHVDDPDALIKAAIVNIDDVNAGKGENGCDARPLQRLCDQLPACYL
jgi:hypothetical protein